MSASHRLERPNAITRPPPAGDQPALAPTTSRALAESLNSVFLGIPDQSRHAE